MKQESDLGHREKLISKLIKYNDKFRAETVQLKSANQVFKELIDEMSQIFKAQYNTIDDLTSRISKLNKKCNYQSIVAEDYNKSFQFFQI